MAINGLGNLGNLLGSFGIGQNQWNQEGNNQMPPPPPPENGGHHHHHGGQDGCQFSQEGQEFGQNGEMPPPPPQNIQGGGFAQNFGGGNW